MIGGCALNVLAALRSSTVSPAVDGSTSSPAWLTADMRTDDGDSERAHASDIVPERGTIPRLRLTDAARLCHKAAGRLALHRLSADADAAAVTAVQQGSKSRPMLAAQCGMRRRQPIVPVLQESA